MGGMRMRRRIALLLAAVMLCLSTAALAEGFVMAGYDDASTGRAWESNLFFERMAKRTGVQLTLKQYSDKDEWAKAKQAMLQGGEMPDVLFKAEMTVSETQALYEAGKLIDLKPYIAAHMPNLASLLAAHPEWEKAITLENGAIAALPMINELQSNNAMWINGTWLDTLGLSAPTTAEELTEVLRAFRDKDPNGNGKKDEIPVTFMGMWDLRYLGHAFGLVANDYYVYQDEAGQVQSILTKDENRAFLTWLNQLWQENLLSHQGFTTADSLRIITDKDAKMTYGLMLAPTPLSLVPAAALEQYDLLMPLVHNGKQIYRDTLGDVTRGTFAVTSACSDPVAVLKWADYLYSEEGCVLAQAGEEDVDFARNADGSWYWISAAEEVTAYVMPHVTIADGGMMPGYVPIDFQLSFEEATTLRVVKQLLALKDTTVAPVPMVTLNAATRARLNEVHASLATYAEVAMIRFVTGEVELTDENWNTFCQTVTDLGLGEVISIWQDAIK